MTAACAVQDVGLRELNVLTLSLVEVGKERGRTKPAKMGDQLLRFLVRSPATFLKVTPYLPLCTTSDRQTSNFLAGQNGNNISPGTISLSSAVQLPSPEYSYNDLSLRAESISSVPNGIGLVTTPPSAHFSSPPPSRQFNLDGSQRTLPQAKPLPQDAISAFYHYFFDAHPFCLPRPRLMELLKERRAPLLELAVHYVGSSYVPAIPTQTYREALDRMILSHSYPKDGWSLQGLMLFAIALHANNDVPRSAQIFGLAQALTLELGLHRAEFSLINGHGDPVLEECWRRTWWQMYTVNGMLCAVNPGVQFRLKDIVTDVPVPCENEEYYSGVSNLLIYFLIFFPFMGFVRIHLTF